MRSSAIPAATAAAEPLLEERGDLRDDVVVARVDLHRPRLALHVHQAEVRVRLGDDLGQLRVAAQRGDVVDELRAELERPPRDLRLRGVDRDGHAPASCSSTGTTRRSSSSTETPSAPGRVDSPPTSTIAAPSSSMRRALATASSGSKLTPPSENESGVTLTTPITDGRGKRCSIGLSSSVGRLGPWASSRHAALRRGDSCARSSARSGMASSGAVLSGLLWQTGAVAAPLVVKYAIDHGIVPRDHHALLVWLFVLLAVGLLEVCAGAFRHSVRDPQPLALGRRRPRRALRPRAAARRDLPRPRRPGRAAEPRLVRLAAHRADDGRDRPHDRLRADRRRASRS